MNKLKILIISYACVPNKGSEEGFGWNCPFYFAQKGYEIDVITRSVGKAAIEQELTKSPNLNIHFHYVDIIKNNNRSGKPTLFGYAINIMWQMKAINYIKHSSITYDFIHHVSWGSLFIGSLFWKLGKPLIFGPCGGGQTTPKYFKSCFGKKWMNESLRNWATKNYPFTSLTGSFSKHCDLILATNEDTAIMAKKAGAKWVELFLDTGLPIDFYPETFPARKSTNKLKLLWVGRLLPRKGIILAIKALAKCDFPVIFTIVGDGPIINELKKSVEELNLTSKVTWLGRVPWLQLKNIFLQHDVFLFPSIRESFGGQVLEAMAYGLPVIALNQGGVKSLIPEKAIIKVPCINPEMTANEIYIRIKQLWNDVKLREQVGNEAYNYSLTQSWKTKTDKLEKYFIHIFTKKGKI